MVDIYLFSISILGRNELNVKSLVGAFNFQPGEGPSSGNALLVGAFSVITKLRMDLFEALLRSQNTLNFDQPQS